QCWPKNFPVRQHPATKSLFKILQSSDNTLTLYPGTWHDFMSDPEGVKGKYIKDCVSRTEAHLSQVAT
ncbi:hypothetical protein HETIRDRAFT_321372, partial [Heterobasidion irregulare TC 32-1]